MLTTYLYWKSVFILLNIYLFTLVLPELLNLLIFLVVVSLRNKTGSEWQLLVEVSRWENVSFKKIHFFHRFYDHLGIVFFNKMAIILRHWNTSVILAYPMLLFIPTHYAYVCKNVCTYVSISISTSSDSLMWRYGYFTFFSSKWKQYWTSSTTKV